MTRRGRGPSRWLLRSLLVLAGAYALAADPPVYLQRLDLPIAEDSIGYPRAVAADPQTGEVFVSDTRKNRILIFDAEGRFLYQIQGGRTFSAPTDLAVDREGFLFVLANHDRHRALIELDFDGRFLREIVPGLPEESVAPNLLSVAVSPAGDRLYALDDANMSLWVVDRDGVLQEAVDLAGQISENQRRDMILGKVNVYGEQVLLTVPSRGTVRAFDLDGNPLGDFGLKGTASCKVAFPTAAALDADGNLVVIDQQRMMILRWDPRTNRCIGEYYGMGDAPGYLYFPLDLSLDRLGRAYVTQGYQGRVQVYGNLSPAAAPPPPAGEAGEGGEAASRAAEDLVHAWAGAWADGRTDDYLSAYSVDYLPWGFADREAWERWRRGQIERDGPVAVEISEIEVELVGTDAARAVFVQRFRSDRYEGRGRKTLLLAREGGGFRIIEERVEPIP